MWDEDMRGVPRSQLWTAMQWARPAVYAEESTAQLERPASPPGGPTTSESPPGPLAEKSVEDEDSLLVARLEALSLNQPHGADALPASQPSSPADVNAVVDGLERLRISQQGGAAGWRSRRAGARAPTPFGYDPPQPPSGQRYRPPGPVFVLDIPQRNAANILVALTATTIANMDDMVRIFKEQKTKLATVTEENEAFWELYDLMIAKMERLNQHSVIDEGERTDLIDHLYQVYSQLGRAFTEQTGIDVQIVVNLNDSDVVTTFVPTGDSSDEDAAAEIESQSSTEDAPDRVSLRPRAQRARAATPEQTVETQIALFRQEERLREVSRRMLVQRRELERLTLTDRANPGPNFTLPIRLPATAANLDGPADAPLQPASANDPAVRANQEPILALPPPPADADAVANLAGELEGLEILPEQGAAQASTQSPGADDPGESGEAGSPADPPEDYWPSAEQASVVPRQNMDRLVELATAASAELERLEQEQAHIATELEQQRRVAQQQSAVEENAQAAGERVYRAFLDGLKDVLDRERGRGPNFRRNQCVCLIDEVIDDTLMPVNVREKLEAIRKRFLLTETLLEEKKMLKFVYEYANKRISSSKQRDAYALAFQRANRLPKVLLKVDRRWNPLKIAIQTLAFRHLGISDTLPVDETPRIRVAMRMLHFEFAFGTRLTASERLQWAFDTDQEDFDISMATLKAIYYEFRWNCSSFETVTVKADELERVLANFPYIFTVARNPEDAKVERRIEADLLAGAVGDDRFKAQWTLKRTLKKPPGRRTAAPRQEIRFECKSPFEELDPVFVTSAAGARATAEAGGGAGPSYRQLHRVQGLSLQGNLDEKFNYWKRFLIRSPFQYDLTFGNGDPILARDPYLEGVTDDTVVSQYAIKVAEDNLIEINPADFDYGPYPPNGDDAGVNEAREAIKANHDRLFEECEMGLSALQIGQWYVLHKRCQREEISTINFQALLQISNELVGVIFGLTREYLWSRFRDEIDTGNSLMLRGLLLGFICEGHLTQDEQYGLFRKLKAYIFANRGSEDFVRLIRACSLFFIPFDRDDIVRAFFAGSDETAHNAIYGGGGSY
jgi:hypothetical protein